MATEQIATVLGAEDVAGEPLPELMGLTTGGEAGSKHACQGGTRL